MSDAKTIYGILTSKGFNVDDSFMKEAFEETEKRHLAKYANKTFAKVKQSNGNAHYRGKECEILETKEDNGHKQYLLDIEVGNTCSKSGFHTLVAYIKTKDSPYWKKIWFDEDEVELIHYDDNGKVIKKSQV